MTNLTIKELQDFNDSQREIIEKQQDEIQRLRQELADVTSKPFAYCTEPRSEILARQQDEIQRLRGELDAAALEVSRLERLVWTPMDAYAEIERLREADVLMVAQFESQEREITMLRGLLRDVMTDFDGYLGESLTRRVREALGE